MNKHEEKITLLIVWHLLLFCSLQFFFFKEPVNSELRLAVLNFLRIFSLNCSYFIIKNTVMPAC